MTACSLPMSQSKGPRPRRVLLGRGWKGGSAGDLVAGMGPSVAESCKSTQPEGSAGARRTLPPQVLGDQLLVATSIREYALGTTPGLSVSYLFAFPRPSQFRSRCEQYPCR